MAEKEEEEKEQKEEKEVGARKRVDEDWKRQAQEEKRRLAAQERRRPAEPRAAAGEPVPKPSFAQFLSGLASQVLISLGEMENPMTGRKQVDLAQAQHTIDLLELLQGKTKGNLTPQEENFLTNVLHDLRLRYVRAAGGGQGASPEQADEPGT